MKYKLVKFTLLLFTVLLLSFCHKEQVMNKIIISTKDAPAAIGPYSQGIVAGGFLFTSGQLPINPVTGEIPATIEEQTKQVLDNLKAIIEAAGSNMGNVVKCTVYLKNMDDFAVMNQVYSTYFTANQPARATVEVSKMAKNALIEIDAIAIIK